MNPRFAVPALFLLAATAACVPPAEPVATAPPPVVAIGPMVGGATMDPSRTILDNAGRSRDHTTLVAALRASGLDRTLAGPGPFTLFAPTNAAFGRLPPTTVETLMHPSNRALLAHLLNYHVVPGRKTRAQIAADARAGGGTAVYRTAAGGTIRVRADGGRIIVTDVNNGRSEVVQADVGHSNGVMHVVGTVLLPTIS